MLSFESAQEALTEIADNLPEEIYRELSGGIILMPESKLSPHAVNNDFYTMGDYNYDRLGRYIRIYYGSFLEVYKRATDEEFIGHMRDVLHHELIHHLESLAGDHSLEKQDDKDLEEYYHNYETRRGDS